MSPEETRPAEMAETVMTATLLFLKENLVASVMSCPVSVLFFFCTVLSSTVLFLLCYVLFYCGLSCPVSVLSFSVSVLFSVYTASSIWARAVNRWMFAVLKTLWVGACVTETAAPR